MGNAVDLGVVEVLHVVAQVLGLETAVDAGDEALLDFQGDALAAVGLERQDDVAHVQHQRALGAVLVRPGEQKAAGPVVPAPRFVGIAVLSHGRVLAERGVEVATGLGPHMQAARLFQQGFGSQHPAFVVFGRQHARQHLGWLHGQQDARAGLENLLLLG
ncbi:hypothetical protein D9M71_694350 [compost metagenome]